ncbi:MAG: glycosyltransferase family 39 protein [Planctomycetes bacterium]|nr:glycosyltransferase family 39 protein [Planctomycetota bacterium]
MTPDQTGFRKTAVLAVLLTGLVLLAYGPCLDNSFWRIDDHRHVLNGAGGPFPNQYFRPGQELSFRLAWAAGGIDPFPYYAMGVLCHLACALLIFALARRLLESRLAAFVAAALFATLFAPHQAVLWMSAHEGVQEVLFSLAALLCWLLHLERGAKTWLLASLACAAAAMCFRQSAINLLPWMLAVQLWARGLKDLVRPARLLAWIPFLVLAALVVQRGLLVPGGVGAAMDWSDPLRLLGRLLRSLGHLPLLVEFERWRFGGIGLYGIGAALLALPLLGAFACARMRRGAGQQTGARPGTALLALALLLGGHVAVLPGEPEIIGERCYYDAAPGFALVLAALFLQARTLCSVAPRLRFMPWLALLVWLALNVRAIHAIEEWKYDRESRRVDAIEAATRAAVAHGVPGEETLFLDPPLPDGRDFLVLLHVWLGVPEQDAAERWLARDDALFSATGGALRLLRWQSERRAWVPFDPGGAEWLAAWTPAWWPGGLNAPDLPQEIRCIRVRRPGDAR